MDRTTTLVNANRVWHVLSNLFSLSVCHPVRAAVDKLDAFPWTDNSSLFSFALCCTRPLCHCLIGTCQHSAVDVYRTSNFWANKRVRDREWGRVTDVVSSTSTKFKAAATATHLTCHTQQFKYQFACAFNRFPSDAEFGDAVVAVTTAIRSETELESAKVIIVCNWRHHLHAHVHPGIKWHFR